MSRMNWDRVRRERNLRRRHYSDDELVVTLPSHRQARRTSRGVSIPVCPTCTLMHPGEC